MSRQQWIDVGYVAGVSVAICFGFWSGSRTVESYIAMVVFWLGLLIGYAAGRTFHP